ncbi:LOW QUALITY PROTEIN: pancreatic progenitor cell differentiation and proliferation factor [Budorcas taxicolor]|uniref:LOW QUALITY PROTEIN: pancreatic progenitor cell differentiation and proliferation factor n=1 Tax=Budorcas taxicolor TaxID=37181 RepID=UPI0022843211|nr:LOW QUALITY PROTEIN: pancreatic progenitor cell differentiation and proliferation factor [Budorcas taxicolor]
MAAIPSSGSLVATHDYYRRRLGSTSSNSSCGSAEYPGEAIPHHPGLPKADPGHWWASFFFGKSTLPFMATVLESPEHSESAQASTSTITCDLAREAVGKQQPSGQPGKTTAGPRPESPPPAARLPSKALGSSEPSSSPCLVPSLPLLSPRPSRLQSGEAVRFLISKQQNTKKEVERIPLSAIRATRTRLPHTP